MRGMPCQHLVMRAQKSESLSWKLIASNTLGAAVLSLSVSGSSAFADAIPKVGAPAPDFTLQSSTGKDISLADLKGKRTVMYFYPVDLIALSIHLSWSLNFSNR